MSFPRVRSARPRISVPFARPDVPEPVRSRVPQRRRQRPWRRYLLGALILVAVVSTVAMVVRRRFGNAEHEAESVEQAMAPTAPPTAPSDEPTAIETMPDQAAAVEEAEAPVGDEEQRFSA